MGAHQDPIQGTEVLTAAVMCALGNGTFDRLVCFAIHNLRLLIPYDTLIMCFFPGTIPHFD